MAKMKSLFKTISGIIAVIAALTLVSAALETVYNPWTYQMDYVVGIGNINKTGYNFTGDYGFFNNGVGIGTASPNQKLVIRDNALVNYPALLRLENRHDAIGDYVGVGFTAGTANFASQSISAIRTGSYGKGDLVFLLRENPGDWLDTNISDEKMRIQSDGNVGIGVTIPTTKLEVNGTVNASAFVDREDGIEWIKPEHISDVDKEDIEGDLNTFVDIPGDTMTGPLNVSTINPNNYGNLTIDSGTFFVDAGNDRVGIGTSSPGTTAAGVVGGDIFHHKGTSGGGTAVIIEGSSGAKLNIIDSGGAANDKFLQFKVDAGIGKFASFTDVPGSRKDNILVLDMGSGNVGIGTTDSDGHKLFVNGSIKVDRVAGIRFGTQDYDRAKIYSNENNDLIFATGIAVDAVIIKNYVGYKRVGIGTTSPEATLTVNGSAIFNEDGGDNDFRVEGDTVVNLFFVDAGNDKVGIGTSTPQNKLNVVGNVNATGFIVNATIGMTGNYSVGTCWINFVGGIAGSTNCTSY